MALAVLDTFTIPSAIHGGNLTPLHLPANGLGRPIPVNSKLIEIVLAILTADYENPANSVRCGFFVDLGGGFDPDFEQRVAGGDWQGSNGPVVVKGVTDRAPVFQLGGDPTQGQQAINPAWWGKNLEARFIVPNAITVGLTVNVKG